MKNHINFLLIFLLFISSTCAAISEVKNEPPTFDQIDNVFTDLEIDKKNGHLNIYFPGTNSIKASGQVKNYKMTGEWSFYSKNTDSTYLKCKGSFIDGFKNGKFTTYYPNGKVKQISFYRKGILNGHVSTFAKNGIPTFQIMYRNGKIHGIFREWFPDGKPKEISKYSNGIKDGTENLYSPNGKRISMGKYSDGKKNGLWQFKYENGRLKAKGYFKNGKKISKWKYYDENGKIIEN